MGDKLRILLFADWYEPGYKAGGPIRSCVNFVRHMHDDYDIFVLTSDRDLGSEAPYEHIRIDEWYRAASNVSLYYCSPEKLTWRNILKQWKAVQPDFIYLNSMFSPKFTIFPLLINRIYKKGAAVVLSPRGMLRESAVQFKPAKKKIFLKTLRLLRMAKEIHFHASDETEANDIRRHFGPLARVSRINNFPAAFPEDPGVLEKHAGEISMIFVGRIHPIKNLDFLLNVLKELRLSIRLTIIGSLEDKGFWEKCRKIISGLPACIDVRYGGEIPNHELPDIIRRHHIFVLPTRGENFGHAIFEALALGKPVMISDQTPWKNLEPCGAGWDIPLDRPELFRQAIEQSAAFGQDEYNERCRSARRYVRDYFARLKLKEDYMELFS
jgi:glycosyltransferase involved in cell wall biosynthesis